jgi:hypothetical protein
MFILSHPHWDVIPRGCLKAEWAERLTEADLGFRAFWVVPSGPFKAEAFRKFQGERGFANAGESCECEYWVLTTRLRLRRKVECSLMYAGVC